MSELEGPLTDYVKRLRRLPTVDDGAIARLRNELQRTARPRVAPTEPGRLTLSPARAIAMAALLVLATSAAWLGGLQIYRARQQATAGAGSRTPVQFVFVAAGARQVTVVGDFNDWDEQATPLSRASNGVWSVIVPLEAGQFAYSFIVDGETWFADPEAAVGTSDFGRPSSVVYVAHAEMMP